jgi:benzoyl-CoA reductase/2-hydroxyglutaryl-CoA dehydratase subunit BcrC/BadD/HgdB
MAPAVVLRGTEASVAYYQELLVELNSRVSEGYRAVPEERFRLYWDGMPIWGKLRELSSLMLSLKTSIVASTYCNSWVFNLNPSDPFRSLARAMLELFICRSDNVKERLLDQAAREFSVDGVVFHEARTCPHNSNTRFGLPSRLRSRLGRPVLTLDGDLVDLRCFSTEQSRTNIEAFIEQLAEA